MSEKLIPASKWWQRRQAGYLVVCCIGWCLFTLGCVPSKVQVQSAPQFDPSAISSIAILPFQALQSPQWGYGQTREVVRDPEEIRMQFRLPCGDQVRPSDSSEDRYAVSDTAARFITSQVESILRTRTLRVVGAGESSLAAPTDDVSSDTSLRVLAKEVGDRLKVDAVLMGKVRTYR